MSDDEVMRFEITDHDLDNEFNFGLRRPKISKNRATYGIWAEDSDQEDDDPDARPSFSGSSSRRGGKADYSAPVGFVSAGFKKTAKEEAEDLANSKGKDEQDSDPDADDTFSSGLGFKPKKSKKKSLKPEMVGGQFAGMRKSGYSQPVSLGKGFGDWEKYTKGIGAKLLLKQGYEPGKGLGKNLQGRSQIVEAHLRKGRGAIGAYGKEGGRPKEQKPDSEEEEEEQFQEQLHQWKRVGKGQTKKVKYVYKSADQILEDGKWRQVSSAGAGGMGGSGEAAKVKIIDMTGKEQRVLSSYHAIGAQKMRPEDEMNELDSKDEAAAKKINFDLPELRHNIDLLLDQCEEELISTDRALKHHQNKIEVLQNEEEKLAILLDKEKKEMNTMKALLELVEELESRHQKGDMDLETARTMIESMEKKYPEEYRGLELPYVAMTIVVPLLKSQLQSWSCLDKPHLHLDEFIKWQQLLQLIEYDGPKQPDPMDPYHSLLWECFMPIVRQSITAWNPKHPDPLIKFLDVWSHVLPRWMKNNIQQHILLPKLQAAVELWDPRTDPVPIHSWLHPWLMTLGDQLEIVYPSIRMKLASALTAWHPSDRSAKLILIPWQDIFDKSAMYSFILKNILPKLEQTMAMELIINPIQQNLDPWHWVMEWFEFIPPPAMINLLERHFFPKWLQVLASWLNQNPNYNEVTNWYKGWKSVMPPELLSAPQVQHQLQQALDFMTRVVTNERHPMASQRGANEAMMYLSTTERQTLPLDSRMGASSKAPSVSDAVKMATQMSSTPSSYKELIARRCEEKDILFRPIPSRFQEGKQVYKCGSLLIYIDRNAIFVQNKDMWIPTSLNTLLDSAA